MIRFIFQTLSRVNMSFAFICLGYLFKYLVIIHLTGYLTTQ